MVIDVVTLGIVGGLVATVGSVFLLLHWWHDRRVWVAFVWGIADLVRGTGIFLLALHAVLPSYVATVVAPFLLINCDVATWASARAFNRGSFAVALALLVATVGIVCVAAVGATGHEALAATLGMGLSTTCFIASAFEFWRGRVEPLRGRWPMFVVLLLQSAGLSIAMVGSLTANPLFGDSTLTVLGSIHLVGLIYVLGSALSLVTMLKDRSERILRAAAFTDSLTGLANRRAFMEGALREFERSSSEEAPISLLTFDLDHFKRINDTFGHAVGDQALRIFARVVSEAIGTSNLAGRLGGEEFAVLLAGSDTDEALHLAQRIRTTFRSNAQFLDGILIDATVSVGVATSPPHGLNLVDLIMSADRALYGAKRQGRDRVVVAARDLSDSYTSNVVRMVGEK